MSYADHCYRRYLAGSNRAADQSDLVLLDEEVDLRRREISSAELPFVPASQIYMNEACLAALALRRAAWERDHPVEPVGVLVQRKLF